MLIIWAGKSTAISSALGDRPTICTSDCEAEKFSYMLFKNIIMLFYDYRICNYKVMYTHIYDIVKKPVYHKPVIKK